MPGKINAKVIWEDNPDTSLVATNLSKSIDIIAESKFIEYTNSISDYSSWADYNFTTQPAPSSIYVDKILYISSSNSFIKGVNTQTGPSFISSGFSTPFNKLLKIKANTKIGMSYVNTSGQIKYLNYDIGTTSALVSIESLLLEQDFSPSMRYNLYLYNTIGLGDYCQIKIVSEYDDENNTSSWKQGIADLSSPTGSKVIAIRKIGGFRTTIDRSIDPDSLWDLTTYNKEIITQKYKILDNTGVRDFVASDISIKDEAGNFVSTDVEGALADVKVSVNQLYEDMYYTDERSGVELEYSIFTKVNGAIQPIDLNNNSLLLPLRITPGYINVDGKRITISSPIYLGDKSNKMKINNCPTLVDQIQLGSAPGNPYSDSPSTTIYPGLWRVYINSNGEIIFRESDLYGAPKFINDQARRGWYSIIDNSRCIGKFRVRADGQMYVEKMSVVNTFDTNVPKNSIHIIHGTVCPDGLFLCDGKWHDITGNSPNVYDNMPAPSGIEWQNNWWVQTPNMYNRQIKMFDESSFSVISNMTVEKSVAQPPFKWQAISGNTNFVAIVSGSSESCGSIGGNTQHSHSISHKHASSGSGWDLRITASPESNHGHELDSFSTNQTTNTTQLGQAIQYNGAGTPLNVTLSSHIHTGSIASQRGQHGHTSFSGQTSEPTSLDSGTTSSFAPYKEFLICIKL